MHIFCGIGNPRFQTLRHRPCLFSFRHCCAMCGTSSGSRHALASAPRLSPFAALGALRSLRGAANPLRGFAFNVCSSRAMSFRRSRAAATACPAPKVGKESLCSPDNRNLKFRSGWSIRVEISSRHCCAMYGTG